MRLKNTMACALFIELVHKKLLVSFQSKEILNNITNKKSFSLWMLGISKVIEKICKKSGKKNYEHIRVKKALYSVNRDIFDFMLHPPNDEVPVIDNSLLIAQSQYQPEYITSTIKPLKLQKLNLN